MNINEELHQWRNQDTPCAKCGRKYPETILNIEGVIHHNARDYICIDRKSCERIIKRNKKEMKQIKSFFKTRQANDPLFMHKVCTAGGFLIGIVAAAAVIAASEHVTEVVDGQA